MYKRTLPSIAVSLLIFSLTACKKDNTGGVKGPLDGDWALSSMHVTSSHTVENTDGSFTDKTVLLSDYTTTNNTGVVAIASEVMSAKDLAYTRSSSDIFTEYQNGTLVQHDTLPGAVSEPPNSSNVSFKLVGTDSIYFSYGPPIPLGNSTNVGGKYTLKDNVLTMTLFYDQTSPSGFIAGQVNGTSHYLGTTYITLTRK